MDLNFVLLKKKITAYHNVSFWVSVGTRVNFTIRYIKPFHVTALYL